MSDARTGGSDRKKIGPGLGGLALLSLALHFIVGTPFFAVFFAGMFAVWAMRGAWWAWIPSGLLGIHALDHAGLYLGGVGLPVLFIAAGVLLFAGDHIWAPARKVGLIVIGLLILAGIFNADERRDRDRNRTVTVNRPAITSAPKTSVIPPLNGRRLVVIARDGEVTIEGQEGITELKTNKMLNVAEREGRVEVTVGNDTDVSLIVPASSSIEVIERDGDVAIKGVTGNITVTGRDGKIRLDLAGDPTVDLLGDSSSDFELFGYEKDEAEGLFHHTGTDQQMVKVTVRSADVFVTRKERVPR